MSPNRRLARSLPLVTALALATLPSCATINATVDPWAREAGVTAGAPVVLWGTVGKVRIYQEGSAEPLKVVMIANPTIEQAVGNALRQSAAQSQANRVGSATYTETMRWSPAIYLRQKQTHRLRIVHEDGRVRNVVMKPRIGKKYFVIDWLLVAPTVFLSLGIDWATGKWQVFDAVHVDRLFATGNSEETLTIEPVVMPLVAAPR